ncbi:MAG: hypothetical protein R3B06_03530 [Kofleriaceae bacterium]
MALAIGGGCVVPPGGTVTSETIAQRGVRPPPVLPRFDGLEPAGDVQLQVGGGAALGTGDAPAGPFAGELAPHQGAGGVHVRIHPMVTVGVVGGVAWGARGDAGATPPASGPAGEVAAALRVAAPIGGGGDGVRVGTAVELGGVGLPVQRGDERSGYTLGGLVRASMHLAYRVGPVAATVAVGFSTDADVDAAVVVRSQAGVTDDPGLVGGAHGIARLAAVGATYDLGDVVRVGITVAGRRTAVPHPLPPVEVGLQLSVSLDHLGGSGGGAGRSATSGAWIP